MSESMPPLLESAINTLVAIAETIPLPPGDRVINQQEAAALLQHIADLDKKAAEVGPLRRTLKFYADELHFSKGDESDWGTVSGEPQNFWW